MVFKLDGIYMKEIFKSYGRDYFSVLGCDTLIDFFDEVNGEDFEFDPIAVCCDCSEYGYNVTLGFSSMLNDYGYLFENMYDVNELELLEESEKVEKLVEILEENTIVLHVTNGNYIVFSF